MKKIAILCVLLSLMFFYCGISMDEHNKLKKELDAVKAENLKLKKQVDFKPDLIDPIRSLNKRFMKAFKNGNASGVASLYTENGQLLPPNGDSVTGKDGIQSAWQGAMDMGIKIIKLHTVEIKGVQNIAYEVGQYTLLGEGDKIIETGKYIVIWKQENGQWKMHRDIWNSSLPAK